LVDLLVQLLVALAVLLGAVALVLALRDRLPPKPLLQGLLLLQALVIAQAVVALSRLGGWEGPTGELIGYLVVAFVLVPGGMVLALEERTRWGTAILGVACLVLAVVVLRLDTVWDSGLVGTGAESAGG
jgi:hypothetical protein